MNTETYLKGLCDAYIPILAELEDSLQYKNDLKRLEQLGTSLRDKVAAIKLPNGTSIITNETEGQYHHGIIINGVQFPEYKFGIVYLLSLESPHPGMPGTKIFPTNEYQMTNAHLSFKQKHEILGEYLPGYDYPAHRGESKHGKTFMFLDDGDGYFWSKKLSEEDGKSKIKIFAEKEKGIYVPKIRSASFDIDSLGSGELTELLNHFGLKQ